MPGKNHRAGRYARRYEAYRRSFVAACFLYLIAYFLGAVLWSRLSLTSFGESLIRSTAESLLLGTGVRFWPSFLSVLLSRLFPQLLLFLLGITCYAPLAWGGVMLWLGLSDGMGLGFLFRFFTEGMNAWLIPTDLLFVFGSALLTSCYASFVLCVYQKQRGRILDSDGRMFGGTMFCGRFEKNGINLRFFISYQLFFVFVLFLQAVLALFYRWTVGLIGS